MAAKLKEDTPWLIDIHCLPHHLELALLELQRSCAFVEKVYEVLHLIWKTYHFSPKSTRELKAVADTMGIGVLKPGQVKGTRWLPHVSRTLKSLIKPRKGDPHNDPGQHAAVLQHMEHLASTSQKADIKGRAKYVAPAMKDVHFLAFCHFLADLFSILETVSLKFQQNDLILPSAVSLPRETYAKVSVRKNVARSPVICSLRWKEQWNCANKDFWSDSAICLKPHPRNPTKRSPQQAPLFVIRLFSM